MWNQDLQECDNDSRRCDLDELHRLVERNASDGGPILSSLTNRMLLSKPCQTGATEGGNAV